MAWQFAQRVSRALATIVAVGGLSLSQVGAAQPSVGPDNRAEAVKIIAELRRIVSPQGLQAIETVRIGIDGDAVP